MKKTTILLVFLLITAAAFASEVPITSTITKIMTYPTGTGAGDITIEMAGNPADGVGFYLDPAEPGSQYTFSLLVLAKSLGQKVTIYYSSDDRWSGSSSSYYKINCVILAD